MNNYWLDTLTQSNYVDVLDGESKAETEHAMHRLALRNIELEAQVKELLEQRKEEQNSQTYQAQVLNLVDVGFIVLDEFGKVKQINAVAANMFERTPSDVKNHSLFALVSRPDKLRNIITWMFTGISSLRYEFEGANTRTIHIEKHFLANDELLIICR